MCKILQVEDNIRESKVGLPPRTVYLVLQIWLTYLSLHLL